MILFIHPTTISSFQLLGARFIVQFVVFSSLLHYSTRMHHFLMSNRATVEPNEYLRRNVLYLPNTAGIIDIIM